MRTAVIYNFLIEAGIMASLAILLMIPVRKWFRKALGNRAICFAWLLVAVRLLCPLALPNPLMNTIVTPYNEDREAINPMAGQLKVRFTDAINDVWNDSYSTLALANPEMEYDDVMDSMHTLNSVREGMYNGRTARAVMNVYVCGFFAVSAWFVLANAHFRRQLKKGRVEAISGELQEYYLSLCESKGVKPLPVYFTDPLASACLVGVARPFIALPLAASPLQARQMLAHEICHYKAKDHLWSLVTLVCCAVHWFNPLVWAAAAMSRMDRELKCDDNVIRDMDEEARRLYAGTLLQAVTRRAMPGMPMLATGMSMTGRKLKTRIRGILRGGKYVRAFALVFAVAASLLLVCAFGTREYGVADTYQANGDELYEEDWFSDGQTMEEALAEEGAVKTEEDAIRIAEGVIARKDVAMDSAGGAWTWDVHTFIGGRRKQVYAVNGTWKGPKGETRHACVCINVDGSGVPSVNIVEKIDSLYDIVNERDVKKDIGLTDEQKQGLIRFALSFTEEMEPGETERFYNIRIMDYVVGDSETYVRLEAPYDKENSNSKGFSILLNGNDMQIVEYGNGNG